MNNNSPFFSILIPVYNVEKYLDECLKSVVGQTFSDFEVILIDDGSSDNSGTICDEYQKKYENIKVIHKKNEGLISARIVARENAIGERIVFLDADDILAVNALEIIFKAIEAFHCDCVVYQLKRVASDAVFDGYEGENSPIIDRVIADKRQLFKYILSSPSNNSLCLKCFHRNVFKISDYSSFYHIKLGEDLLQSLDPLNNCKKVVFINNVLYLYRTNPTSITHSIDYSNYKVDYTIREEVLRFLKREDFFTDDDYREYNDICIDIVINEIKRITNSQLKIGQKKALFDKMRETDYIKRFFAPNALVDRQNVRYKRLKSFFNGHYCLFLIRGYFSNVKRTIRNILKCR